MNILVTPTGDKFYYNDKGQLHRKNGYAAEWKNGTRYWYEHGVLRVRDDKPSVIDTDGNKFYVSHSKLSRLNGPAIEYVSGEKWWIVDGVVTRDDGPAMIDKDGNKFWCKNGATHRIGGYAVEKKDPGQCEYWVDGIKFESAFPFTSRSGNKRTCLPLSLQDTLNKYSGWLTYPNGDKVHYYKGQMHSPFTESVSEPAIIRANGSKEWYEYDILGRSDLDPVTKELLPTIEYANGDKEWYALNVLHRVNGPAIVTRRGDKFYYKNGVLDREELPAIEYADGSCEWWSEGDFQYSILNN